MDPKPDAPPPHAVLLNLVFGKNMTQAVGVVARFRLADHLATGPKTAPELATLAGLRPEPLYRVLRMCAGLGVLSADDADRFALTPVGNLLRSDVPGSIRPMAEFMTDEWCWRPWRSVPKCLRTGEPVFEAEFGETCWDYLEKHPDQAATFNAGMTTFSERVIDDVLKAYDFSPFRTIVDVGGGHGALLSAILERNPTARGLLFDASSVIAGAVKELKKRGMADRVRTEAGSFFESVPAGGDLYVLKHIVHDWNDAKATRILECCRKAIAPAGKLLLVELVVPPGYGPSPSHWLDLEMLVVCDGKERTEPEFRTLLAGAGFKLTRVVPTDGLHNLIEAVPA